MSLHPELVKCCQLLEVDPPSNNVDVLKKAYKKLAMQHHPDKGGNEEKFKQVKDAFDKAVDIITNPPPQQQHIPNIGENPFFQQFFGNMGINMNFRTRDTPVKGRDIQADIQVSLEDVYTGCTRDCAIDIDVPCSVCTKNCHTCNGTGNITRVHTIMPGVHQQIKTVCVHCNGRCFIVEAKPSCQVCNGKGLNTKNEKLHICVEPGIPEGSTLTFKGLGEQMPHSNKNGDLHIRVDIPKMEPFDRKGADLHVNISLSFIESFMGKDIKLKLPSKEDMVFNTRDFDTVISPQKVYTFTGKGLPKHKEPNSYGDLHMHFDIVYPPLKWRLLMPDEQHKLSADIHVMMSKII